MTHLLTFVTYLLVFSLLAILGVWGYLRWTHRRVIRVASKCLSVFPTLPVLGSLYYLCFGYELTMTHLLTLVTYLLVFSLLAILGVWGYVRWTHRRVIRVASKCLSVFPTLPVLGSLYYLCFGYEYFTGRLIHLICERLSQGLKTLVFWVGPFPFIYILDVDDIQKLLTSTKTTEKGDEMKAFSMFFKNGLLNAPGHIWKHTRRAIDPVFHPRNLVKLLPTLNRNCEELVRNLDEHEGQGAIDLFPHLLNTTLKSVCHLCFGPDLEFDTRSKDFQSLIEFVKLGADLLFTKTIMGELIFDFIYSKKVNELNRFLYTFTNLHVKTARNINDIKETHTKEMIENSYKQLNSYGEEGYLNLISAFSVLQKNNPEFTDEDLNGEIVTMFGTGSDTIATLISSCLLLLAEHPDIQERVYEEIKSEVGLEGDVRADDHKKMPYLDQVFKESSRWSKIVQFITRKPSADIELSSCTIPKGCSVIVGLMGPMVDPNIYPQPQKFDPDRFLHENSNGRHKCAHAPFSAGVRQCIAKVYADILFKTAIIHVLRRFRLTTTVESNKLKMKNAIFCASTEGYKVSLHPRREKIN